MMEASENTNRRSERKRKRKESYSPEGKKEGCRKKAEGQNRTKLSSSRLCDVLPNGEHFSCHLCKSPYVVNPISKGVKKTGRSRHMPLPKVRVDKNTGREMMLCNACVQIFDRPQRRSLKARTVPTEEEKTKYQEEVDNFIKTLKAQFDDPLVDRLFCPLSQRKLCGCLLRYIESAGFSQVPSFISLMKEAIELRKEKSYPVADENKKVKFIGLGNGHKKSKRYEEFVLHKRRILKEDMRLCERATQKILMYSNNFLHKRLKTENRPCRVERTRGKGALGQLPDFQSMQDLHCCHDNCVMMARTHKRLLQSWRDRAQQGQQEARRVMAEMLTPAGATHHNCYSFISMITGCSQSTIASVYNQMLDTGGLRDPPEHGMKKVWQDHYKQTKTSDGSKDTSASVSSADNVSQEVTSSHRLTNQNAVTDFESLGAVRQHKLAWIQDLARNQLQQQQLALHLQDLMSAKQKIAPATQQQASAQNKQPQNKPSEARKNPLLIPNTLSVNQLQQYPIPTTTWLNPTNIGNQGQFSVGQGHNSSGQGHMQQILLQPPPQYGVNQASSEKLWNQSQLPFPINVNQTSYVLTGDQQVLPVTCIPLLKHGSEQQLVPRNEVVIDTSNKNTSLSKVTQIFPVQLENLNSGQPVESQTETLVTSQVMSEQPNDTNLASVNHTISLSTHSQNQVARQFHIVGDQTIPVLHFQSPAISNTNGEPVTSLAQTADSSPRFASTADNINENINPNIYLQIIPETPIKTNVLEADKSSSVAVTKEAQATLQSKQHNFLTSTLPRSKTSGQVQVSDGSRAEMSHLKSKQQEVKGDITSFDRTADQSTNILSKSGVHLTGEEQFNKHISENVVTNGATFENSSTMILSTVQNQADQEFQPMNQTQLIVPVSLFPPSQSSDAGDVQIPSQIQISFQTCSAETNQPNLTQQILLPHSNVVTLPLMPIPSDKVTDSTNSQLVKSKESSTLQLNSAESNLVVENKTVTHLSRENLQFNVLNQKEVVSNITDKPQKSVVKSRNSSGNSRKSRNSSGSSELLRKSVVQFSNTVRSESQEEHSHRDTSLEQFSESHIVSKLNKNRPRQLSGNSEHGDRSRKSSGNSLISESSSHASGLTLSNLASPNIFHDKDKGIFFIQSLDGLELNEIDGSHIVDFIQAVEADQTGTVEEQNTARNQSDNLGGGTEVTMLNQSHIFEAESKKVHNGRADGMLNEQIVLSNHLNPDGAVSLKQSNSNFKKDKVHCGSVLHEYSTEKLTKRTVEFTGDFHMQSNCSIKSHHKKSSNTNSKKQSWRNDQSSNCTKIDKANLNENQSTAVALKFDVNVTAASFVPIAPKGSQLSCSVDSTLSNNSPSHNTPVLCSLLSKKPASWTKKLVTSSIS